MEILKRSSTINKSIEDLKSEINSFLLSLPDNPDIKRISKQPRVFIINSSVVFNKNMRLDPEYYDWDYQYSMLVRKVNETSYENLINVIRSIIKKKSTIIDNRKVLFHPEVINQLKTVLQ